MISVSIFLSHAFSLLNLHDALHLLICSGPLPLDVLDKAFFLPQGAEMDGDILRGMGSLLTAPMGAVEVGAVVSQGGDEAVQVGLILVKLRAGLNGILR